MDKRANNLNMILVIALALSLLVGFANDLYIPSLPAIGHYFHAPDRLVKLMIPAYFLMFAVGQLFFGTFSDSFGRRNSLMVGVFIFVGASLIALSSHSIYILLWMRSLQGAGAGAMAAVNKTLLTDSFTGKKLNHAFNYNTIAWALGPIVGPAIGGYLQFYFNWQANFYFYAIFSALVFLLIFLALTETLQEPHEFKFSTIANRYWHVFRNPLFISSATMLGLGYAIVIVFIVTAPFLIQNTLGYSAIVYGHMALLLGLAYLIGCIVSRWLLNYFSPLRVISIGIFGMTLTVIAYLVSAYTLPLSLGLIVIPALFIVFFEGLVYANTLSLCMAQFTKTAGVASAGLGIMVNIFTAIAATSTSFLAHNTLIPVVWSYSALILAIMMIYLFMFSKEAKRS